MMNDEKEGVVIKKLIKATVSPSKEEKGHFTFYSDMGI
jgi:hypothetical protein